MIKVKNIRRAEIGYGISIEKRADSNIETALARKIQKMLLENSFLCEIEFGEKTRQGGN